MALAALIAALKADFRSKVPVIIWLTTSLAVAISGPFGSYSNQTFVERLLYWPPLIALVVVVSTVIRHLVSLVIVPEHRLARGLVTALLIASTLCLPLFYVVHLVFDPVFEGMAGVLDIFLVMLCIALGVCALRMALDPEVPALQAIEAPAEKASAPPRLMRRIEAGQQGQIWAMTVRDHYVDVQTDRGKVSLLMRFSDAMDEVYPLQGAQVHRSHWVAWEGVGSVCRDGGKMFLHLKNGSQIPVSRNHRGKVDARFPPVEDPIKDAAA